MASQYPKIGILQGRLTPAHGRDIQFFPDKEWEDEFKIAREICFDAIELLVKADGHETNPLFSDRGVKEINSLKTEFQIETPSVHGFYSKEAWYPDVLDKLIKQASLVGAKTILISFFKDNALKTEADRQIAQAQLVKPLKIAANLGISLAIETEIPAPELKSFIETFESSALGVYYDIGNMASIGANVAEEIRLLGALIKGVHIKDRKANGGETVPLGDGNADFKSAFGALKKIGYNGPYIIQGVRSETIDDISLNKSYLTFVRKNLKIL